MNMRVVIVAAFAVSLAGCPDASEPEGPRFATDRDAASKLFLQCLEALPAGPASTKYNDWDEVVHACHRAASWLAPQVCVRNCREAGDE